MAIYSRDNINYNSMLQNMLAQRARGAEIRSNNIRKQGEIWGGAVKDIGSMVGRAYGAYGSTSDAEAELADLEKERAELLEQQQKEEEAKMAEYNDYAAQMQGYHPNAVAAPRVQYDNPYAVPGNPNATQEDYFNYLQYMNGIYGGK